MGHRGPARDHEPVVPEDGPEAVVEGVVETSCRRQQDGHPGHAERGQGLDAGVSVPGERSAWRGGYRLAAPKHGHVLAFNPGRTANVYNAISTKALQAQTATIEARESGDQDFTDVWAASS